MAEPTPSTAKKLAALSLNRCPFPGCPMMLVDPRYKTFQGDVCHIRSRKGQGPRHDPNYTGDLNGEPNLILMCKVHNSVIDDPQNLQLFPVSTLENWKRDIDIKATNYPHAELEETLVRGIQESIEYKVLEDKEGARIRVVAGRVLQCDGITEFVTIKAINTGNTFATIKSVSVGYADQSVTSEEARDLRYKNITVPGNSDYEFPVARLSTFLSKFPAEREDGLVFHSVANETPIPDPFDSNPVQTRGASIILDFENLFRSKIRLCTSFSVLFKKNSLGAE